MGTTALSAQKAPHSSASKRPNSYMCSPMCSPIDCGHSSCGYAGDRYARTPIIDTMAAERCNFT